MSMIEKQIDELKSLSNNLRYSYGYKSDSDLVDDAIETIQLLSAKLHEQNCHGGWIPCDEKMPEEHVESDGYVEPSKPVLVQTTNGTIYISKFWGNRKSKREYPNTYNDWCDIDRKADEIVAWMPLPEEYKE